MQAITLQILETPKEMEEVENLQRSIWPGSDVDIVPAHLLLAAAHNGGLVIGAYGQLADSGESEVTMLGFVFGFPGLYQTPDGPRPKHCSHMLGVDPRLRDQGIGFKLKRAQWQMVRKQGLDLVTWTYDPLLSRNAHLNIVKLGAVCNTYIENEYGDMRDGINFGLPSDRFQVDWWVNTQRVNHRLSTGARRSLDLAHYIAGGVEIINPSTINDMGLPQPIPSEAVIADWINPGVLRPLLLVEIPADFPALKAMDFELAFDWRTHTRDIFGASFRAGYLVTDFVHLPGTHPRSFYALSHGESTL